MPKLRTPISIKIGIVFVLLAMLFGGALATNAYLTRELIGASAAINHAGAQRMRVYKLAYLMQEMTMKGPTHLQRQVLLDEMNDLERVLLGLQRGDSDLGLPAETDPIVLARIQSIRDEWMTQMRPRVQRMMEAVGKEHDEVLGEYNRRISGFAASVSAVVEVIEQRLAQRISLLYWLQLAFLVTAVLLVALGILTLHRMVRIPLKRLTEGVDQVSAGELTPTIPIHSKDELGDLARAFEMMSGRIRTHIEHLEALFGLESAGGKSGTLEDVLKRTAETAASLVGAEAGVLLVRHPILECWTIEAATGELFRSLHKHLVLFEQTPFANQAFETRRPVIVDNLTEFWDQAVFFRETLGAKSYLAVPLVGPQQSIGVLALIRKVEGRSFTEREVRLAQQSAAYAAFAFANARLFETVESHSQDLLGRMKTLEHQVAELTHEVKAPAGRVAEFASWIQRDYGEQLDERANRYLDWIKKEGSDLVHLAERTLDFARILREPTPLETVDANEVVKELLDVLSEQCAARGIRVEVNGPLPPLACRRVHLKQVMGNLLSNAIKYMGDQPAPLIQIGTEEDHEGMCIFVRDNGIGIDPEMTGRIFQPFQRLAAVDVPGAGIGLAIVKTVVEHYGGSITVTSKPGCGSTFRIRLPPARHAGAPGPAGE
jgi:signal transduction histidine kinase/HAMP domain-containing protein